MDYELLDSGHGEKLERFGSLLLVRPCPQAVWSPQLPPNRWKQASARFSRDGGMAWSQPLPHSWEVTIEGVRLRLKPTDFGHVGVFPEHAIFWNWIRKRVSPSTKILNLFAYSGGATFAAAQGGAQVTHVDASKGMVSWARENATLNDLSQAPIRWIVEDVHKFLIRAHKRGDYYEGLIVDPPSFGRGREREVFKIEEGLPELLALCAKVLAERPRFLVLSCHTPGYTPLVLKQLLQEYLPAGQIEEGEMILPPSHPERWKVPCGTYARWTPC